MVKQRENNYDLLRICSAFAVVMLHVSGSFLRWDSNGVPMNISFLVIVLNHIVRFAVPCFFMLSGAFVLADTRNSDCKYFYAKSIRKIGITGALFCLLYMIYDATKLWVNVFIMHAQSGDKFWEGVFNIFRNLLEGHPYGHLWFLFAIAGAYVVTPLIIRFTNENRSGETVRKLTTQ